MDYQSVKSNFSADGHATLIGSLPLADHGDALRLITGHTPAIPLWPQLPSNPQEGMLNQFIEGFPGIVEGPDRTYFNTADNDFAESLLPFFEEFLAVSEDPAQLLDSRFKISENRARGLYLLQQTAKNGSPIALKGQITGPFTLLTGLSDQDHRLGYYDPSVREMSVKGLAMKAAWQTAFLNQTDLPCLMFIDEPALAGLGSSSFISISLEDIGQDIGEVIEAIHSAGGLAGVHVCANTDWEFLLSLPLDIVSFDAYGFFDRFVTCKNSIYSFLDRGGIIAWGGVPTSEKEDISRATPETLVQMWEEQADLLVSDKYDKHRLLQQMLITPSCGTGSLPLDFATRVLELTSKVSETLREKYLDR